ncbi:MAG TPA: rRNA maturation RNase YbeY [Dehalococcoidia bacterium]|nr:rRNA maturation RNase YbeY [Dehalococcoidia bacterium]
MGWPCIMVVNMPWEINVQVAPGPRPVSKRWLVGLVGRLLGLMEIPAAEVGLVLTGEEEIRQLNRQFRGVDEPTDVLAFPLEGDPVFPSPDGRRHLGEVFISLPRARDQARAYRHPFKRELALLVAHGLLHLLGYDDQQPRAKRRMFREQARLLSQLEDLF